MSDSPKGLGIGEELSPYARGTNHLLAIAIDEYQTKNTFSVALDCGDCRTDDTFGSRTIVE